MYMENKVYADAILLKYEHGEYEDHELVVFNVLDKNSTLLEITDIAKLFLKEYAHNGYSPSYTGMTIFADHWKNGKIVKSIEIGDVYHDYDDDRDGLSVWKCDWEIGETECFYPYGK